MSKNCFKLLALSLCAGVAVLHFATVRSARANAGGPPASRTGGPGELTCATSDCHRSFALNSGSGTLTLTGLPGNGYALNQSYDLTITLNQASRGAYGFQVTALDDQGRRAGELVVTVTSRTQRITGVVGGNLRQYIQHTPGGTNPSGANQGSWTFRWTAPAQSAGRVTFYYAGNAANGDTSELGDFIYTRSTSVQPASTGPQTVATVSAASFTQGALARESIAALFAAGGLAGGTVTASTIPLPTTLGGVQVKVRDAANTERDAPLFFVSAGQINFLVPQGTGNGAATITVMRDGSAVGQGPLTIEAVGPGFFSAAANGQGLAAAVVLRVKSDNTQTIEAISQNGQPIPIDLGPESDQVFLIAFGSGWRGRNTANTPTATIGGAAADVSFAGAQGDLAGLDQANIKIPRSLIGRGLVNIVMTIDGKTTNAVQMSIR
jgi:uncharacterized protein (TIGR03437 family)